MKRLLSIVMLVVVVTVVVTFTKMAIAAPAEFLWTTLGGDPRDERGVWSWDEYGRHALSRAGQNDWNRVLMPGPVRQVLFSAIRARNWNKKTRIGNYVVTLQDIFVPQGTKYHFITYGAGGYAIRSVRVGFSNGAAYRAIVECPDGVKWTYDTFKRCANGAVLSVFTQDSTSIPQQSAVPYCTSPAPASVRKRRFEYGALDMPYQPLGFARRTVTSPGIIGPLSHVLGEWLGRPVSNINFSTGAVYGSTSNSNGGSISTVSGPITATAGGGNSSASATGGQGGSATGGNSIATGGQGGSATGGNSSATGGTSINSNVNENVANSNATNTNNNDVTASGGQGGEGGQGGCSGPITNTNNNNNDATSGSQSGVTNVTGVNTGDGSVQIDPIGTDLQQGSGTDQTNH